MVQKKLTSNHKKGGLNNNDSKRERDRQTERERARIKKYIKRSIEKKGGIMMYKCQYVYQLLCRMNTHYSQIFINILSIKSSRVWCHRKPNCFFYIYQFIRLISLLSLLNDQFTSIMLRFIYFSFSLADN